MSKIEAITIESNESFLRQISTPVDIENDVNLQKDIDVLDEYCKDNEVMAMASVQLGIPKRLVYLKNTNLDIINKLQTDGSTKEDEDYNESRVLINPVITKREGLTEYWEACASCLDNFGLVKRPYKINVEFYDLNNEKHTDIFEGFESTVLSHEMDHLDGILHIDIADELLIMNQEQRKAYRQNHGYNIISKTGNYDELKGSNKVYKK